MSVRLQVTRTLSAGLERVWDVVVDWPGQSRWVPLTRVRLASAESAGLGVRVEALSGVWVGRWPLGLLDRFVVTGWRPPADGRAELEVLHLGPYFTGEGVFRLEGDADVTTMTCVEIINVPGGAVADRIVRLLLPLMRAGFRHSLGSLERLARST